MHKSETIYPSPSSSHFEPLLLSPFYGGQFAACTVFSTLCVIKFAKEGDKGKRAESQIYTRQRMNNEYIIHF